MSNADNPYLSAAPIDAEIVDETTHVVEPRPSGPWLTLAWGLAAGVVWLIGQIGVAVVFVACFMFANQKQNVDDLGARLQSNGLLLALSTIVANPLAIAVLALAANLRRYPVLKYLGLGRVSVRDFIIGLACLTVFLPLFDGLTILCGRPVVPPFMTEVYQTAGWLPLLIFALVVAAPVGEEIFFRGFLYRGLAESRLGPWIAILLTTLLWTAIHLQYDWFQLLQVAALGCVLGWLRWKTGSTTLTIVLHAISNAVATIETIVSVELLS
jgi:hypothetical protein